MATVPMNGISFFRDGADRDCCRRANRRGIDLIAARLVRRDRRGEVIASLAASVCVGLWVLGSTPLRAASDSWSWVEKPAVESLVAGSPESMVESLVQKLKVHPDDLAGWLMLGRSYAVLREYPLAVRAYKRADGLADGRSAEALLGEAQALMQIDGSQITGRAGDLIERALAVAPSNSRALLFGAVVALHRGKLPLARARLTRLLALDPSASTKAFVQSQLAAIDRKLSPGSAVTAPRSQAAATAAPQIRVNVELAPRLLEHAPRTAPLYVFVRDAGQPGLPLAVKRLQSRFPQTVRLTPADSMIPGRSFASGERVLVVARIAPSGNPVDQSGDLSGETAYRVGRNGLVNLVIDHVTP
jgi:cytochrome c-type biogenesis protein CcmH